MKVKEEILLRIIDKWGPEVQILKIQEEALELALAINNRSIPTKDPAAVEMNLYEELADMKIMMAQAEIIFDAGRINGIVEYKLKAVQKYFK